MNFEWVFRVQPVLQAFRNYPVFVVHYTPLKDRKLHLTEQLRREALLERCHWIENFDREVIKEWPELENPVNRLSKGVIAVNMAHVDAIRRISESSSHDYGLILEDDVILTPGAAQQIEKYSVELPRDWDFLSV